MSQSYEVILVQSKNAGIDIVNSKGTGEVHAEINQQLWPLPGSSDPAGIFDGIGSYRPASTGLQDPMALILHINLQPIDPFGNPTDGNPINIVNDILEIQPVDDNGNSLGPSVTKTLNSVDPTVDVYLKPNWAQSGFPWGYNGDVTWKIHSSQYGDFVHKTYLEIYGLTEALTSFWQGRVSVKFLRAFVLPARPTPTLAPSGDWTSYVARSAFEDFGFKYDIVNARARYCGGSNGGTYDLRRWTNSAIADDGSTTTNCYDQAGIVQIALSLGDVQSDWMLMSPYGFLKGTTLLGYPDKLCNNPIKDPQLPEDNWMWLSNDDPLRKSFPNHAFIRVKQNYAVDACAGPALGDKTMEQYITETIQPKTPTPNPVSPSDSRTSPTSLYWSQTGGYDYTTAGTYTQTSAKVPNTGIWGIDRCSLRDLSPHWDSSNLTSTDLANSAMTEARSGVELAPPTIKYRFDIFDLNTQVENIMLQDAPNATLNDHYVAANEFGFTMIWDYVDKTNKAPDIELAIDCLADGNHAIQQFKRRLDQISALKEQDLKHVPSGTIGETMSLLSTSEGSGFVLWVRGNICIQVTGKQTSAALLDPFAQDLDSWFCDYTSAATDMVYIPTSEISGGLSSVQPSANFKVDVDIPPGLTVFDSTYSWLDVDPIRDPTKGRDTEYDSPKLITLLHCKSDTPKDGPGKVSFKFRAGSAPADHKIKFTFVDKNTAQFVTISQLVTVKSA